MKNLLLSVLAALLFAGCATSTQPTGTSAVVVSKLSDPAFIGKVSMFITTASANGVAAAIVSQKDPANAVAYATAVRDTLALLRTGQDYSPGALAKALSNLPIKEINGGYGKLIVTNLLLAYELYYAEVVKAAVDTQPVAGQWIDAAITGINLGLSGSAPAIADKP